MKQHSSWSWSPQSPRVYRLLLSCPHDLFVLIHSVSTVIQLCDYSEERVVLLTWRFSACTALQRADESSARQTQSGQPPADWEEAPWAAGWEVLSGYEGSWHKKLTFRVSPSQSLEQLNIIRSCRGNCPSERDSLASYRQDFGPLPYPLTGRWVWVWGQGLNLKQHEQENVFKTLQTANKLLLIIKQ